MAVPTTCLIHGLPTKNTPVHDNADPPNDEFVAFLSDSRYSSLAVQAAGLHPGRAGRHVDPAAGGVPDAGARVVVGPAALHVGEAEVLVDGQAGLALPDELVGLGRVGVEVGEVGAGSAPRR